MIYVKKLLLCKNGFALAFHFAAINKDSELVNKLLLEDKYYKINEYDSYLHISEKDSIVMSWLYRYCLKGRTDLVEMILQSGFQHEIHKNDGIILLIYWGKVDLVKKFISAGYDVNSCSNMLNKMPLSAAIMKNNYELVEFLVEKGANCDRRSIAEACSTRDERMVICLLEHCEVNLIPIFGMSCVQNQIAIAQILLQKLQNDYDKQTITSILNHALLCNCKWRYRVGKGQLKTMGFLLKNWVNDVNAAMLIINEQGINIRHKDDKLEMIELLLSFKDHSASNDSIIDLSEPKYSYLYNHIYMNFCRDSGRYNWFLYARELMLHYYYRRDIA
ncbi:ankyrin repeat-containing domain protein [Glomus cerebriforme]|uniref:Ankyrin repeat-containing domain protein n=1 Tax=Glomus cerebriforme TaxID=658196 RepID=A0A397S249_9GLOM|nr:ankyrin repeat-containing domain protein [Glomus cerebriforme]